MRLELPTTKVTYQLPKILSADEVRRIIQSTGNIKHRTLLTVIYSAGLRVSEAVNLITSDIDSSRKTLHIRCCKNRKDRYVVLSPTAESLLREYWRYSRFQPYVFPGQDSNKPMTTSSAARVFKQAKRRAGITKSGGIHALRHAFATHALEAGTDLFVIKELLGHASIQSTVRYLRFIPDRHSNFKSPIESLQL